MPCCRKQGDDVVMTRMSPARVGYENQARRTERDSIGEHPCAHGPPDPRDRDRIRKGWRAPPPLSNGTFMARI